MAEAHELTLKQAVECAGHHSEDREHAFTLRIHHQVSKKELLSFKIGRVCRSEDELMKTLAKDGPGDQSVSAPDSEFVETPSPQDDKRKEKKKMGLRKILKGEVAVTREDVADAIEKRAAKIMNKEGLSCSAAYEKAFNEGYVAYERTPKLMTPVLPVAKREVVPIAKSEETLEELAHKIAKRDRVSMPIAMERACAQQPDLFRSIEGEHLAIAKMQGTQVGQMRKTTSDVGRLQDADDDLDANDGGDECPKCKRKLKSGGKFCPSCGEKVKADGADWPGLGGREHGGVDTGMLARR